MLLSEPSEEDAWIVIVRSLVFGHSRTYWHELMVSMRLISMVMHYLDTLCINHEGSKLWW